MPAERTDITLTYLRTVTGLLERIYEEEYDSIGKAAEAVAAQVRQDRLVYIFGRGGHSNLAAQEVFFRAGGVDIAVDTKVPVGDAVTRIDEVGEPVGAVSTSPTRTRSTRWCSARFSCSPTAAWSRRCGAAATRPAATRPTPGSATG
jgi:uncharacterized phosphosugar-binding protein